MKVSPKYSLSATSRLMEVYCWFILGIVVGGRPFYWGLLRGQFNIEGFFLEFYSEILFAILVILFPFLFKLIYSEFPLEYLRNKRKAKLINELEKRFEELSLHRDIEPYEKEATSQSNSNDLFEELSLSTNFKEDILLEQFLAKSRMISDKLYSRAGAYLLIGCLIAFAGVLFFYFQTATLHAALASIKDLHSSRMLFEYLPRIGTLVFVEAIAFFFLKQYRVTMEEYRYYEAIKRQRENQVAILDLFNNFWDKPELFEKLMQALSFNNNPNKLSGGDTTTIIEAEKLSSKEGDIIDKLLEFLKLYKK